MVNIKEAQAALTRAGWRWIGVDGDRGRLGHVWVRGHRACTVYTDDEDIVTSAHHVEFHETGDAATPWIAVATCEEEEDRQVTYWCRPVADDETGEIWYYEIHAECDSRAAEYILDTHVVQLSIRDHDLERCLVSIAASLDRKVDRRRTQ